MLSPVPAVVPSLFSLHSEAWSSPFQAHAPIRQELTVNAQGGGTDSLLRNCKVDRIGACLDLGDKPAGLGVAVFARDGERGFLGIDGADGNLVVTEGGTVAGA